MSLATGLAVAVLAPLLIAMAPIVALAAVVGHRRDERRRARLRRREQGLASWETS